MDENQRAESVKHCKWVDEVVERAPWVVTQEFLDEHQVATRTRRRAQRRLSAFGAD